MELKCIKVCIFKSQTKKQIIYCWLLDWYSDIHFFAWHCWRSVYKENLKRFRTFFPEYKEYKLYGAIAAMTYDKDVIDEAKNFGFYILGQNNDKIKLLNSDDFTPNEIK